MKPLKLLGLTALAVAALIALLGTGSASATVLCKEAGTGSPTGSTCPSGQAYGAGQEIHAVNKGTVKLDTSFKTVECTGSEIKGETSKEGSSTETVTGPEGTLAFSGCNCETVKTIKAGTLEIHWISGTSNGTVTSSGAKITTICNVFLIGKVHCTYLTSNTDIGTLTGGSPATLTASSHIPVLESESDGICPEESTWTASYEVTAPKPLYVASLTGSATATTLTTSLSGEEKSGEEITILEGSKAKDTATLSGANASKATGTVKYKVYADKECKELVTSAGEVTVSAGKVPASEEKELEAGRVYYWQAEYSGDSNNLKSTSACGKEVLTVKAKTSLSTSLSGEETSGEEITILEGGKAKDTATLSGAKSSTATGKVKFRAYKDKECKELASEAGEGNLSEGKASSEEKTLEAGAVYYWQAEYPGDSLHQASTSACSEVLIVKAKTSLSTTLSAEEEELIEGEEITVFEGTPVKDNATLGGTRYATATGEVSFDVYADSECKELVAEAGEASLKEGSAGPSEEVELEEGTYYWQASYEGDSLHQASTSTCGKELLVVNKPKFVPEINGIFAKGGPATIVPHTFFTGLRSITCNKATLGSPVFGVPVESVEITTSVYQECTSAGLPATVKTNGCSYRIFASGRFDIEHCAATEIELAIYANAADHAAGTVLCGYKIGNQEKLKRVRFANEGAMAGRDISFRFEVTGIVIMKVVGSILQCGETNDGASYGGTTTMKAFDSAPPNAQVGWWRQ